VGIDPLSCGVAFATGWCVNLSYHRWRDWRLRKRQAKGDYFTATCSGGYIDFEGRVKIPNSITTDSSGDIDVETPDKRHISAEEILKKLFESAKSVK
jgi:hypothetical protein